MRLWRVSHVNDLDRAWEGGGSRLKGGRWNSPGRALVYSSEHAALALVEVLAYVGMQDLGVFRLLTGTIPDACVTTQPAGAIPEGWDASPHAVVSRCVGDAWLAAAASAALRVPSSLVPGYNVLLNPRHPDFARFEPEADVREIPFATRSPEGA